MATVATGIEAFPVQVGEFPIEIATVAISSGIPAIEIATIAIRMAKPPIPGGSARRSKRRKA